MTGHPKYREVLRDPRPALALASIGAWSAAQARSLMAWPPRRDTIGLVHASRIQWLDGLRGVAILLVLAFHLTGPLQPDTRALRVVTTVTGVGWCGVDLFFVLSGYLITRNLLADDADGRLGRFWFRRALRILPAYLMLLAGAALLGHRPDLACWTFLANWAAVDRGTLDHLWSLSVEEQFYLVWPLAVTFLPRRRLVVAAVLVIAAAPVLRLFLGPMHAYRWTPARADALLMGAMLALSPTMRLPWRAIAAGCVLVLGGIALIVKGLLWSHPLVQGPGYSAIALFFASIIGMGGSTAWLRAPLETRWLRSVGRVSYGMYLVHWPIVKSAWPYLTAAQVGTSHVTRLAIVGSFALLAAVVTYVVAWVSYDWVEGPILRWGRQRLLLRPQTAQ